MELPHPDVHVPIHAFLAALDSDSKDGVGPGAVLIHISRSDRTFHKEKTPLKM